MEPKDLFARAIYPMSKHIGTCMGAYASDHIPFLKRPEMLCLSQKYIWISILKVEKIPILKFQ